MFPLLLCAVRRLSQLLLLALLVAWQPLAVAAPGGDAVLLVAHPAFRDMDYRETVLIAAPAPNGGHVGLILNRPTRRSLASLFPEHAPSKQVKEPVYYGGPFSRGAVVALVRSKEQPDPGAVQIMGNVYMAFRAAVIDRVIEKTPNEARYFVGYVGWRPGELRNEIDRGLWAVLSADTDILFSRETDGLWEQMLEQSRRLRADRGAPARIALHSR